jgi:serpin B
VHVLLPKFKMEDTRDLDKVLPEMGMKLAFLQREADFSGIGPEKYPPIFVQRVIHKAVIDLDEEGTKASALTGTFGGMGGMAPDRKPIFAANRPFLFFIVDERTKCVLFLGRVAELPGRPFTGEMPSLESLVPGGVSRDVKPRGGSGMF